MVWIRNQNVPGKIGEARPAGYTHRKAAQRPTKNQVERFYISRLAWSRLGVEPEELSEVVENRGVFWIPQGPLLPLGNSPEENRYRKRRNQGIHHLPRQWESKTPFPSEFVTVGWIRTFASSLQAPEILLWRNSSRVAPQTFASPFSPLKHMTMLITITMLVMNRAKQSAGKRRWSLNCACFEVLLRNATFDKIPISSFVSVLTKRNEMKNITRQTVKIKRALQIKRYPKVYLERRYKFMGFELLLPRIFLRYQQWASILSSLKKYI